MTSILQKDELKELLNKAVELTKDASVDSQAQFYDDDIKVGIECLVDNASLENRSTEVVLN